MKPPTHLLPIALLATWTSTVSAGVLQGQVVDHLGQPVAGANLDVINNGGGGDPAVANDGTNGSGIFSTTVTPDGVYDVLFVPPAGSSSLVRTLTDVVVVGTQNLGTIVLAQGAQVSGILSNHLGQPMGGVNLDVLDSSGNLLTTPNDLSDAFGNFSVVVPLGASTLRFKPLIATPLSAPLELELDLAGSTSLGVVSLSQGFLISGTVVRSGGAAVPGCDIDVYLSLGGAKLFTPGDNTDSSGFFDMVVPAGTFDLEIGPPFAEHLVTKQLLLQVTNGDVSIGVQVLQPGVVLSGIVQAFDGQKYPNVDVDLFVSSSGTEVPLTMDNTASNGAYQVIVPTGTFTVRFTPPYALPLASQVLSNVVISTNKTQHGTLPSCPFYVNVGSGTAGTGGLVPTLTSSSAPRLGNENYPLVIGNGRGGATALLTWSPFVSSFVFGAKQYQILERLQLSGAAGQAGAGSATRILSISDNPAWIGIVLQARACVLDPLAASGKAWTPYLHATIQL